MANQYDVVAQLTSGQLLEGDRTLRLNEFSRALGWRPSDRLDIPAVHRIASAQLLVEHGLEHSAVLTFLRTPLQFPDLGSEQRQQLLATSYNNLVDWHVAIEPAFVNFVFVRTRAQPLVERRPISRDQYDNLRSEIFEEVVGRRPQPNFPALDDALIKTISFWKRGLASEVPSATNTNLAKLFNAIIFVRALEDQRRRIQPNVERALLREITGAARTTTIRQILGSTMRELVDTVPPHFYLGDELVVFDRLDGDTVRSLLTQFYDNQHAPYPYDFAVISKHALSRIYEHYVSLLRHDVSDQLSLLPEMPSEYGDRSKGAVYTPQFIARFFARFLREHTTPFEFKRLRVTDPACGSGIFLRTLLEFQCDPTGDGLRPDIVNAAFQNAVGIDKDANAIAATQLSLSLLHLVLTGQLPDRLPLLVHEFIGTELPPGANGFRDAVIANPPFVPLDLQDTAMRARVSEVMGDAGFGRLDLYLPFLKRSLDMIAPGGFGLFVLPQSFLVGKNAAGMRRLLSKECWIRCLADLSAVRVFGETNVYVVLLIFQKKDRETSEPKATILKCQDLVGHALQDAIEGRRVEGRYYSIYDANQSVFQSDAWFILPPTEAGIRDRLASLPKLVDLLEVKQGVVTGADDVFIVDTPGLPDDDESLFLPLLSDREMERYSVPRRTAKHVFFPYFNGRKVDEATLRKRFPLTWKYLLKHKKTLEARRSIRRYRKEWWEPMWPRDPKTLLRPKIVTPHLVFVPRFGIDLKGRFAVTRSPFLIGRAETNDLDFLKLMLAVLNSRICYWFIQRHSHVYSHGYAQLEGKTLAQTPIPDVTQIAPASARTLLELIDKRIAATTRDIIAQCEDAIEELVTDLYGLTSKERQALGLSESL